MNLIPPSPPLEPGDSLTRDEFERRYEAMPNLKKAELIEGVVVMPSPIRWNHHARPHIHLGGWLAAYEAGTPGVQAGDNGSVRLDLDNEPQPDLTLIVDPTLGGQARLSEDDYIEGAPEWIGEIAASSASIDLNTKFRVYRRNNVREYVVWRVLDKTVDWFVMRQGQYERLPLSATGFYQSEMFPGLWLDPAALVLFDLAKVLQVVQEGIASPEHAAFVARLQVPK
jgi:Uma2 family endonuclease